MKPPQTLIDIIRDDYQEIAALTDRLLTVFQETDAKRSSVMLACLMAAGDACRRSGPSREEFARFASMAYDSMFAVNSAGSNGSTEGTLQ